MKNDLFSAISLGFQPIFKNNLILKSLINMITKPENWLL